MNVNDPRSASIERLCGGKPRQHPARHHPSGGRAQRGGRTRARRTVRPPAPRPRWPRRWRSPTSWAWTPSTPTATSAGPRRAGSPTARVLATITHTDVVPGATAGAPTLHGPRADGWLLGRGVTDDTKAKHPLPVRAEVPEGQRRGAKIPRACPAGANEETNMHDVDYAEHYPMPAFCFTPGRRVPGLQRREGRLQRRARQPEV